MKHVTQYFPTLSFNCLIYRYAIKINVSLLQSMTVKCRAILNLLYDCQASNHFESLENWLCSNDETEQPIRRLLTINIGEHSGLLSLCFVQLLHSQLFSAQLSLAKHVSLRFIKKNLTSTVWILVLCDLWIFPGKVE